MGEDASIRVHRAGRAPGVPRCQCLWQPVSSKCGSPRTSVSAPPPFLARGMGSVLSCYTSSLLGGFWTGCRSSHAGSEGFPSTWPGRGAARGAQQPPGCASAGCGGKGGAVCNNTLSVGRPLILSRTTLDTWGIRKSAASRRPGPGLSFPAEGGGQETWGQLGGDCEPGFTLEHRIRRRQSLTPRPRCNSLRPCSPIPSVLGKRKCPRVPASWCLVRTRPDTGALHVCPRGPRAPARRAHR